MLPPGFRFGTSTASYQIEGAAAEDGRGPSIWDTFSAEPGRIVDGSTGEVACDHYHRVEEDVALMQELGTGGYRFSIAWPRIQPTGRGTGQRAGPRVLRPAHRHAARPRPAADGDALPLGPAAGARGRRRLAQPRHGRPVRRLRRDRRASGSPTASSTGCRSTSPTSASILGYGLGTHAPGKKLLFDCLPAAHHLLLAHGRAAIELRRAGATSIGCANNHSPIWPASDDDADVGMSKIFDALWNGMFLEPMLLGRYPADLMPLFEDVLRDGDLATIRQPLDFYGVNYYSPLRVAAADEDAEIPFDFREVVGYPTTESGWPVVPDALREWLVTFRARFRAALPPIYITESGCSYDIAPRRARRRRRPDPHRLPPLPPRRGLARRSPAASTCAATTAGR